MERGVAVDPSSADRPWFLLSSHTGGGGWPPTNVFPGHNCLYFQLLLLPSGNVVGANREPCRKTASGD